MKLLAASLLMLFGLVSMAPCIHAYMPAAPPSAPRITVDIDTAAVAPEIEIWMAQDAHVTCTHAGAVLQICEGMVGTANCWVSSGGVVTTRPGGLPITCRQEMK